MWRIYQIVRKFIFNFNILFHKMLTNLQQKLANNSSASQFKTAKKTHILRKTFSAAFKVSWITSLLCAAEINPASKAEGAK